MLRDGLLLAALGLVACSGRSLDVGPGGDNTSETNTGGAAASSAGAGNAAPLCTSDTPLPTWPDDAGCVASSDLPLVGTWSGYVEQAGPPFDTLQLTIRGASTSGGLCGTLTIGQGAPPPVASNPNVGYPNPTDATTNYGDPTLVQGYAFTLLNGVTDGARVRFSISQAQPLRGWCQLQTSYAGVLGGNCTCVPDWGYTGNVPGQRGANADGTCVIEPPDPITGVASADSPRNIVANCAQVKICESSRGVCACNSTGCEASPTASNIDFDLRFTANAAQGSSTAPSNNATAYFARTQ